MSILISQPGDRTAVAVDYGGSRITDAVAWEPCAIWR